MLKRIGFASLLCGAAVLATAASASPASAEGPSPGLLGGLLGGLTPVVNDTTSGLADVVNGATSTLLGDAAPQVSLALDDDGLGLSADLAGLTGSQVDLGLGLADDIEVGLGLDTPLLQAGIDTGLLHDDTLLGAVVGAHVGAPGLPGLDVGLDLGVSGDGIGADVALPGITLDVDLDPANGLAVDLGLGDTGIGLGLHPDHGLELEVTPPGGHPAPGVEDGGPGTTTPGSTTPVQPGTPSLISPAPQTPLASTAPDAAVQTPVPSQPTSAAGDAPVMPPAGSGVVASIPGMSEAVTGLTPIPAERPPTGTSLPAAWLGWINAGFAPVSRVIDGGSNAFGGAGGSSQAVSAATVLALTCAAYWLLVGSGHGRRLKPFTVQTFVPPG